MGKVKKQLALPGILLVAVTIVFMGWHAFSSSTDSNIPMNCGTEGYTHFPDPAIRDCMLDAFNACTPAYAEVTIDRVEEEFPNYRKLVKIEQNSDGKCGIRYTEKGRNYRGESYAYDNLCTSVQIAVDPQEDRWLDLSDCEGAEYGRLF